MLSGEGLLITSVLGNELSLSLHAMRPLFDPSWGLRALFGVDGPASS